MSAGLKGNVELKQIKLGAGRLFIGQTSSVTFDGTTKFNTESPASNWKDLGNIANEATLNMTVDMFTLKNGIPSLAKKRFIIGRDGELTVTSNEFSSYVNRLALGLAAPVNKLTGVEKVVAGSPSPTASIFTLDAVTGLAVGDEIAVAATTGDLASTDNKGLIQAIDTLQITLTAPLYAAPSAGWKVQENRSTKLWFGGGVLPTYPLLYVIDLLENKQVVYYFGRVSIKPDYSIDNGRGVENAKLSLVFQTYGVNDTDANASCLCVIYTFEDEVAPA